ncbi:hypothetical protein OAC68_04285 [Gammaproteobacteria bacterium]|nr:hypothetical protein [Gammaproteobacteria bacterium]
MKEEYKYFIQGPASLVLKVEEEFGAAEIAITLDHEGIDASPFYFDDHNVKNQAKLSYFIEDAVDQKINLSLDDCPPVDAEIISKMRECETIFLKQADRFLSSCYQERKDRYLQYLRTWNYLLDARLDFAIFRNIPHEGFDYIIYCLCKLKGIQTFCFYALPIRPNKGVMLHMLQDIREPGRDIFENFKKMSESSADIDINASTLLHYYDDLANPEEDFLSFTRAEKNTMGSLGLLGKLVKKFAHAFLSMNISTLPYRMRRAIKNYIFYDRYFMPIHRFNREYSKISVTPQLDEQYIYFPMHFQPEASTSPLAGEFVDLLLIIQMLSYHAGPNIKIYVKEHPRQGLSSKSIHFLKDALKCSNVVFINNEVHTGKVIENSLAIATCSGSAGIEGLLRKKPILMFGNRFYQYAPGVFQIRCNKDLQSALTQISADNFFIDIDAVKLFLKSADPFIFPGFITPKDVVLSKVSLERTSENMINAINTALTNDSL